MLSQAGPGGRPLTPSELLERAREQVVATFGDDPVLLVEMMSLISGRYFDLRDTEGEYATLQMAEKYARQSGDPQLIVWVHCDTIETDVQLGRPDEAARRIDEVRRLLPEIRPYSALDHAICLKGEAVYLGAIDNIDAALERSNEARTILERYERHQRHRVRGYTQPHRTRLR